jgi:hypothetical protein
VHFTIPAYHSNEGDAGGQDEAFAVAAAAATPAAPDAALQASLPAASLPAANRIVLSLIVQEDGKVGAELAERNGCLSSAQERLDEAQQQVQPAMSHPTAFAQPGAAVGSASSSVLRHSAATDAELPAAAETDAANTTDPADQPVQVVFNILESHKPEDQENSAGTADPPGEGGAELPGACPPSDISAAEQASIQQQLQRVEACREELARQAGQLRGRVAKVRSWMQSQVGSWCCAVCCAVPQIQRHSMHLWQASILLPPKCDPLTAAGGRGARGGEPGQSASR